MIEKGEKIREQRGEEKECQVENKLEMNEISQKRSEIVVLSNINLTVEPGQFIGIIGKVGGGKSSLLYAMVDEMIKTSGTAEKNGTVAIITQEAFLVNATLRENILLAIAYEKIIMI